MASRSVAAGGAALRSSDSNRLTNGWTDCDASVLQVEEEVVAAGAKAEAAVNTPATAETQQQQQENGGSVASGVTYENEVFDLEDSSSQEEQQESKR